MDHAETNPIDENKPNIIRKKSSFLRDGSYRIFHITKKSKEDSDDDDRRTNNNLDQTINKKTDPRNTKSLKNTNRNGLKQFFFPHKTSCDSSLSIEIKTSPELRHQTNEVSQSVVCHDTASVNLLEKNKDHDKQDNKADRAKANVTGGTITRNNLLDRADKFESPCRKQVFINTHPEMQASFHRRRNRFIVACSTVIVALSVIITIIVYVVVMTVRFITETNRLARHSHPRL